MEDSTTQTKVLYPKNKPGPWPWYALLITGIGLTGFFVWAMVCLAFLARGKKLVCMWAAAANLVVFFVAWWAGANALCAWWKLFLIFFAANLLWTAGAFFCQYKVLGRASARYVLSRSGSWFTPIATGMTIGFCMAVLLSIPEAIDSRVEMMSLWDTLNREIVLWNFFKSTFFGILAGLFVGLWYAGNPEGFKTRDIITYLSAFFVCIIFWGAMGSLLFFLINGGMEFGLIDSAKESLIVSWTTGSRAHVIKLGVLTELVCLFTMPLFFGSPARFRDFAKRMLIIPLVFLCHSPFFFVDNNSWAILQGRIIYDMSAPKDNARDRAHKIMGILLKRYPNHANWPKHASDHASFLYNNGRYDEAKKFYKEIEGRFSGQNQWYWYVSHARSILADPNYANPNSDDWLDILIVDHEDYLSHNWMALLSLIRYWEGESVPESAIKSRLRDISKSPERIMLRALPTLAHLDDAARNLGFEVLILPTDLAMVQAFLGHGIPVICSNYRHFVLAFGYDISRSTVLGYNFSNLSSRLLKEKRKEAGEMLGIQDEGQGESRLRRQRIQNQAYCEMPPETWEDRIINAISPFMAVVFPADKYDSVEAATGIDFESLKKQSNGHLASLIALMHIDNADPAKALEWAMVSSQNISGPMPLYAAHLAGELWENRAKNVKSAIRLQDRFSELHEIFIFFDKPENKAFLKQAKKRLEADRDSAGLPWIIEKSYIDMLDKNDPAQLAALIRVGEHMALANPAWAGAWARLADIYDFSQDIQNMVRALNGQFSANPLAHKAKLRAAYGNILLDNFSMAEKILKYTDKKKIRHEADYQFVLGAIDEDANKPEKALKRYANAVDMRPYKPMYQLYYGRLLLSMGKNKDAKKALNWVCRIDAENKIREQARELLDIMEP